MSENSVQSYLASPRFTVRGGKVTQASTAEIAAQKVGPPHHTKGAVPVSETEWGYQTVVSQAHAERGYSFQIPKQVAYANGLRPDTRLTTTVADTDVSASVIWRPFDSTVDVGRVRHALDRLEFAIGDDIIVVPTPTEVRLLRPDELSPVKPEKPGSLEDVLDGIF